MRQDAIPELAVAEKLTTPVQMIYYQQKHFVETN